jgi:hypothetical protein
MKNSFYQNVLVGLFLFLCTLASANAAPKGDYVHLDPAHVIPKNLLNEAINFYDSNLDKILNQRIMGIIDFKQHNSKKRFYVIDMESGQVEAYLTAHGKNSDPKFTGYATNFSNTPDSLMSSLGFYITAESYNGKNGYSMRLDGLSSTNSNARERGIVIHGADYVTPGFKIGRSSGCPAVEQIYHADLIDRLKNGALIYAGLGI